MPKKLSGKCEKCGNPGESIWIHGGDHYLFCRGCAAILKNHDGGGVVRLFLDDRLKLNKVDKAMLEARIDRNKGKSLWKKDN